MARLSRERVRALVDDRRFQRFVMVVILINAVLLGLETSAGLMAATNNLPLGLGRVALGIFVVELALRVYAYRWRFFTDSWNVFDLVVVSVALVPSPGPFSALRTLRVLRALRLMSVVPPMRRAVSALISALPGMAAVAALLGLVIYVAAVMATQMFHELQPEHFGHLGTTLFTLFQVMTGEAWPDIANELMTKAPMAWLFFVVYILVSSFVVLNLFIAVIVNALERGVTSEVASDLMEAEEQHAAEQAEADRQIMDELRELRAEGAQLRADVAALRAELSDRTVESGER
jgi:voltage-gated sodium channel